MRLSLRFGARALGIGIFYHAQKRILYVHPLPLVAVLVHLCKHEWCYPQDVAGSVRERRCVECGHAQERRADDHGFLLWADK